MWRQGITALFGKPSDQEDGWPVSQRTFLPEWELKSPFILKADGVWLVTADFVVLARPWKGCDNPCSYSCPGRSCHNEPPREPLFSLLHPFLSIWVEKCYTFKGQAWEAEPWERATMYISGYRHHSFTRCRANRTKHSKQSTKVSARGLGSMWSQVCSLLQLLSVNAHSTILEEKGWGTFWLLPTKQVWRYGHCVMEMVNLGLEVLPSPRLGMNSLNHGDVDTLFITTLRQALEHTHKLGIRLLMMLCLWTLYLQKKRVIFPLWPHLK